MIRKENINWYRFNNPLQEKDIHTEVIPFLISKNFLDLLKISDGGRIYNSDFEYFDIYNKKKIEQTLSFFYGIKTKEYNLIDEYNNPPEFFPKGLVAFAETGNGDLICFDYRSDPKTDNPSIVYWNHEADIGKDVSFVAKDFEEFLTLLHEPDDLKD